MMSVEMNPVTELVEQAELFQKGLRILLNEMHGRVSLDVVIDTLLSTGLDHLHHSALHDCADDPAEAGQLVKEHMIVVLDSLLEEVWVNEKLDAGSV